MRRQTARFTSMVLSVVVLGVMADPVLGEQTVGTDPEIMILVFDNDGLPQPTLAGAEQQMAAIFLWAGINIIWRNCSLASEKSNQACHEIPGPTQFVVTIVARGQRSTEDVFGAAFLDENGVGKYSDIFFDSIIKLHRDAGANQARLLGAVTAHEIGHLLLGSHSHSPWGIMSRHWEQDHLRRLDRGALLFTSEQAFRMRAGIRLSSRASR
jgi:hypothetical protein